MSLITFVKISQVNNLSDARYCAGMGVNLMGFIIDQTHLDYIDPEKFDEIAGWISGVEYVGEFQTNDFNLIKETINNYPVQYIQFEHAELADAIKSLGLLSIFKVSLVQNDSYKDLADTIKFLSDKIDYVLLDDFEDNQLEKYQDTLQEISLTVPIIISGNITRKNIKDILDQYPIHGINLYGGNEIKPGLKDFDELADVLEELEMDEYS